MKLGTKSLLFGIHQFILHPLFVTWGWKKYHKRWPNWKELVCIVIHDWGYWGCKSMDGEDGKEHPQWAAEWSFTHLDYRSLNFIKRRKDNFKYRHLCLYHSTSTAKLHKMSISNLCWPDKLGSVLQPWWLWVGLGLLSGEIHEYYNNEEFRKRLNQPTSYKNYFMAYRNYILKQIIYNKESQCQK